jgi:hypothetical protein
MITTKCPRYGSDMKEDGSDYLHEQKDNDVAIHLYSAYVCQCGYMEESKL